MIKRDEVVCHPFEKKMSKNNAPRGVPEGYNHEDHANEWGIMARSIAKLLLARKANAMCW